MGCVQKGLDSLENQTIQNNETLIIEPSVESRIEIASSYNPVLLYSLTQEYLENSGTHYGLFKLYLWISEEAEQVNLYARVRQYSDWIINKLNFSDGLYEANTMSHTHLWIIPMRLRLKLQILRFLKEVIVLGGTLIAGKNQRNRWR
jgi:hypothetical protein